MIALLHHSKFLERWLHKVSAVLGEMHPPSTSRARFVGSGVAKGCRGEHLHQATSCPGVTEQVG